MNFRMVLLSIGKIFTIMAFLMILPLIYSIAVGDNMYYTFIITIFAFAISSILLHYFSKPVNTTMHAVEGFLTVAISWILVTLIGTLPFLLCGYFPNIIDAIFETISGFTTTGSSILNDIEALPDSILFWRSFTQWIGGIGILVFVLSVLPNSGAGSLSLVKAESSGKKFSKLVSTVKSTTQILCIIYAMLSILLFVILCFAKLPFLDTIALTFSTAGTGGFSVLNASVAGYNSAFVEIVITVFMFIFSINFGVYYLILIGKLKEAFKNEELKWYFFIVIGSILIIALNIIGQYDNFWDSLRDSAFQVLSYISTCGFGTVNITTWPILAQSLMLLIMVIGGCAGSTSGGLKVFRLAIVSKAMFNSNKTIYKTHAFVPVKFNGQTQDGDEVYRIIQFFVMYIFFIIAGVLTISLIDNLDFTTIFSACITTIGNVGPGLSQIEAFHNFNCFSSLSKLVLSILMLVGRLEFIPMLVLLSPKTYKNN